MKNFENNNGSTLLVKGGSPRWYIGAGLGLIIISVFTLPLAFGFGKTGKNTAILGKDYSLLTKNQIKDRLLVDFPLPVSLILKSPSREFTLNLSSISAEINRDHVASNLLFRRLNQGFKNYFLAFFTPKNFPLEFIYDSTALDKYIADLSSQINRPFIPSELSYDQKTSKIKIISGEIGWQVNSGELKKQLISFLNYYDITTPIPIPLTSVGELPSDSQKSVAAATAAKIIGKTLHLVVPDQTVVLDDKTLIPWLDFNNSCRIDLIREYVGGLKTSLKKDPVDAVFKFENGKVLDFISDQSGYTLNDAGLEDLICGQIINLAGVPDKIVKYSLPVILSAAKVVNSDLNNLGIKDLLGTGKSTFKSSSTIRNFNVEKGSSIVNRILVAPGDTFSFIQSLGEVTLESGFKKAYVIRAGKTELDVGGGICQVSTTLFRAMLNAGLDITSRQPHAYRVGYYEEDSLPGYDATVFIPNPDLKFINDTGHHLLIQSTYNGIKKTLVYDIYGTSDGRQVAISNYRRWDSTPPPPDIYIDDPTLPPGKVIQDEHSIAGLKTAFDWQVTRGSEVIHQKTFQSSYVPWAAVYRRGPTPNP